EKDGLSRERYDAQFAAACERMAKTRPTAVNLFYAIDEMKKTYAQTGGSLVALKDALYQRATAMFQEDVATCKAIGEQGADAICTLAPAKLNILTHCNTGSLATAGYGTALGVIRSLYARGRLGMVYVDETRPWLQGARLTAFELAKDNIPYRLIADGAA